MRVPLLQRVLAFFAPKRKALPAPGPSPELGRRGIPGTAWSGWRPTVEGAPELRGTAWARTAREMMRTDPKLAGYFLIIKNALLAAKFVVVPGDATAEAERNAEFLREALGLEGRPTRLRGDGFEGALARMLLFLPVGFRVLEEVYYSADGRWWLEEWADTEPESIREWVRDERGRLESVQQEMTSGALRMPDPIPSNKALILTLGGSGDNYEGCGMLRAAWTWWRLKRHVIDQLAVGTERWAMPVPLIQPDIADMASAGYHDADYEKILDQAAEWAGRFTSHESSFAIAPVGVKLSTFGDGAYDTSGPLAVIAHANQEMATSMVLQFAELGLGDVGSRAVGQVHWNSWRQSSGNALDYVCDRIGGPARPGGGLADRLISLNFYGEWRTCPPSKRPRLTHVGLDVDGLSDAIGSIASLVSCGGLTPTDDVEARLRRLMGLTTDAPKRDWNDRLSRSSTTSVPLDPGGRPQEGERDSQ